VVASGRGADSAALVPLAFVVVVVNTKRPASFVRHPVNVTFGFFRSWSAFSCRPVVLCAASVAMVHPATIAVVKATFILFM
jgi:hypothetical protein